MKRIIWLVSLFLMSALGAEAMAQDSNPLIGRQLYRSYCLLCHGTYGRGGGPVAVKLKLEPSDLTSEHYSEMAVNDLALIIAGYRKKEISDMPNWGMVFSVSEMTDVASYISKLTITALKFKGDPRRGRNIFKSSCVACHGKFGKGRGVLISLIPDLIKTSMLDFTKTEDMKTMSDTKLTNFIRYGKGDYMPGWEGTLNEDEIIDVAAYVRLLTQ